MPWQECQKMDERLRFVARLLEGEKMAALCREWGNAPTSFGKVVWAVIGPENEL